MKDYDDDVYEIARNSKQRCPVDLDDWKHGKDHFTGVLECLYGYKPLKDLEWHLEEVCYMFNVKIPEPRKKEDE